MLYVTALIPGMVILAAALGARWAPPLTPTAVVLGVSTASLIAATVYLSRRD